MERVPSATSGDLKMPLGDVWGNSWLDSWNGSWKQASGGGSAVVFFNGVSMADGASHHQGISRPTVQLTPAGGGTYTVTVEHRISGNLNPGMVNAESYLIDGELP